MLIIGILSIFFLVSHLNAAVVVSDFEDGTLDGWSKETPYFNLLFGGNLAVSDFGNPGYSMGAQDTVGGGGLKK
jgi:hypothetical protein